MAEKTSVPTLSFGAAVTIAAIELFDQLTAKVPFEGGEPVHMIDFGATVFETLTLQAVLVVIGSGLFEAARRTYRTLKPQG